MHTLSEDGLNLLELLRGFVSAQQYSPDGTHTCPIRTLDISDALYATHTGGLTLRNLAVVLDDVGQASPQLGDILAGHFAMTAALNRTPLNGVSVDDVFSVNGSHPAADVHVTLDFSAETVSVVRHGETLNLTDSKALFHRIRDAGWLTHSASLCGVLHRIVGAISHPLNQTELRVPHASVRALVYAAAERHDHAYGYGPYRNGTGFGEQFDITNVVTDARHAVFAYLNQLADHCESPLRDALGVVSGRAIAVFGVPSQIGTSQ